MNEESEYGPRDFLEHYLYTGKINYRKYEEILELTDEEIIIEMHKLDQDELLQ